MDGSETKRIPNEYGRGISFYEFIRRMLGTLLIASLFALFFLFLFYAIHVLLLITAGILLAVFLRSLSRWVGLALRLSDLAALALVVSALIVLTFVVSWWLAPEIVAQGRLFSRRLPEAVARIQEYLQQTSWGQVVLQQIPAAEELNISVSRLFSQTVGALSTIFAFVTDTIIILFVGLYLAAEPEVYAEGITRLAPPARRPKVRAVLADLARVLRWWLVGRFLSMAIVGILSGLGYWLLGVPLALTLALLAGVLSFVPNIGPVLSAIPAVLLAFTVAPVTALWVTVLIVAVQALDGYLVTPLIQRRTILLAPGLVIGAQVALGLTLGFLALFLATPLAAVLTVLVERFYIEGVLHDTQDGAG